MSRMTIEQRQFEALDQIYHACIGDAAKKQLIAEFNVMGVNDILFVTAKVETEAQTNITYEFVVLDTGTILFSDGGLKPITPTQWKRISTGGYAEKGGAA